MNEQRTMTHKQASNLFFFVAGLLTAGWLAGFPSGKSALASLVIGVWYRRFTYTALFWHFYYKWFKGIE